MPGFKITEPMGRAIRQAKAAGASGRAIAEQIGESFGTPIDQRSINRYLKANPGKPSKNRPEHVPTAPRPDDGKALDEIETLQARVRDLNERLSDADIEPRLIAPLNAELRQTFASIRKADKARTEAKSRASGDTAWVVAKLKRFVSMKATGGAAKEDDAAVPPAAGAGGS